MFVVCCSLFVACRLLRGVDCCSSFVVRWSLFVVRCCLLLVMSCFCSLIVGFLFLLAIVVWPFVRRCFLIVVYCSLLDICRLLLVVGCLMVAVR